MNPLPFQIENYNLYTCNKWYLQVNFEKLSEYTGVENCTFNITKFQIPELIIPSSDIAAMGVNFPVPTLVRKENKSLNINYLLSSNLHQYKILYNIFSLIAKEDGTSSMQGNPDYYLDSYLFFLDEFKKMTVLIHFNKCWLTRIGTLNLSYKTADEIEHDFTLQYAYFNFENV